MEAKLQTLAAALKRERDPRPGIALTRAITAAAAQQRNPMPFDTFVNLYVAAINTLDPNSSLYYAITCYFAQPDYQCEVTTCIGQYTGSTQHHKTREYHRGGFMRPFRTYSPSEIMYKWSVAVMQATFLPVLEEIIRVHDTAALMKSPIRGGGCESICSVVSTTPPDTSDTADKQSIFTAFSLAYEAKYGRKYMAYEQFTGRNAAAKYVYDLTLTYLGTHVKADGDIAQNLPKDNPAYTTTVTRHLDILEHVKRRISNSYSVPQIRASEINFARVMGRMAEAAASSSSIGSSSSSSSSSIISSSSSSSRTSSSDSLSDYTYGHLHITINGGNVTINI